MRFIGNKESIKGEIYGLLESRGLADRGLTLFDAFCGAGSVADFMKSHFDLIINDILRWCVVYTKGRIFADDCTFARLGFDPFDYFNAGHGERRGFIFRNYSPGGSERMYFTAENAARIDYFRCSIEAWKDAGLLSEREYAYLLACLIESVSSVSNTAGVYGAFLKTWDPRARKPIVFSRADSCRAAHGGVRALNGKIEDVIGGVDCDILYLDPPYTQNQYGTQYHLLETLVRNDNPAISRVTGSRYTAPMRSDWSKEYKANILFDRVVARTRARYILLSYNNDGFMSKEFIESCLKRYGIPETYLCRKITYKKYRNWKTKGDKKHFEYLFFIERKPRDEVVFESPLNYVGSKAKMVCEIRKNLPANVGTVIDAFGGGFNAGINIGAGRVLYNDLNCYVAGLVESFRETDPYDYLLFLRRTIRKFRLEKGNAGAYREARAYYNALPREKKDPKLLYAVVLYGFQQQIRFNGDHEFNNPAGNRWFNDKVLEKFISFSRVIRERDCRFLSRDFRELENLADGGTFVYLDPPYRFTRGSYNDGKRGFEGWTKEHEAALFAFADRLDAGHVPFMLSYVLEHGGHANEELKEWLGARRNYRVIDIPQRQGRYADRKEILIVNYGQAALRD